MSADALLDGASLDWDFLVSEIPPNLRGTMPVNVGRATTASQIVRDGIAGVVERVVGR